MPQGETAISFDASGLARVIGPPPEIAGQVRRLAVEHGVNVRLSLAGTLTAAWVLAHAQPGTTIVPAGGEAEALAPLALGRLATLPEALGTRHWALADTLIILRRWGLRTLGDLARLPRADIRARLGPAGLRLHEASRGEDEAPLVPAVSAVRFCERLELDWPVDDLEPLSFALSRVCETLSASLERADRGAVTVTTTLWLVTRQTHVRALHLPAPMRDAKVLRTLILLDLESHPPDAGVDAVELDLEVSPGPIVQGSLLEPFSLSCGLYEEVRTALVRALPRVEDVATLVARLGALAGELRVGAPAVMDTHDERAWTMIAFQINDKGKGQRAKGRGEGKEKRSEVASNQEMSWPASAGSSPLPFALCPLPCLRRFRLPIPARVTFERGVPVSVVPSARGLTGGRVRSAAGPWRTSGRWWALDRSGWDRDVWEVELADRALYRIARDRTTGQWEVEGTLD